MSRALPGVGVGPRSIGGSQKSGTDWLLISSLTMSLAVVIFVLCSTVMPRAVKRAQFARFTAAQHDMRVLASAIRHFRLDCDRYPTTDEGLRALIVRPADSHGWNGPYISDLPRDPWHHAYQFESPGPEGRGFQLRSLGPARRIHGESRYDLVIDDLGL
jgi:general secretion pathway protein G